MSGDGRQKRGPIPIDQDQKEAKKLEEMMNRLDRTQVSVVPQREERKGVMSEHVGKDVKLGKKSKAGNLFGNADSPYAEEKFNPFDGEKGMNDISVIDLKPKAWGRNRFDDSIVDQEQKSLLGLSHPDDDYELDPFGLENDMGKNAGKEEISSPDKPVSKSSESPSKKSVVSQNKEIEKEEEIEDDEQEGDKSQENDENDNSDDIDLLKEASKLKKHLKKQQSQIKIEKQELDSPKKEQSPSPKSVNDEENIIKANQAEGEEEFEKVESNQDERTKYRGRTRRERKR